MNYDLDKMIRTYYTSQAAKRGDEEHAFAKEAIRLRKKLASSKKTLNMYVNDAIGYGMSPEVKLVYSDLFYGTTDAIGFSQRKKLLRVHDLKTGVTPASHHQLEGYVAFFCLEYGMSPFDIGIEMRIYQNDEIQVFIGDADKIMHIMEHIKLSDKMIRKIRLEELQ